MRCISEVYLASQEASGRGEGYAMYGHVLKGVVVGSRYVFSLIRGMLYRDDSYV